MTREEKRQREQARRLQNVRIARERERMSIIVQGGKCPECGSALRRNTSMSGWWQCEQIGAPSFRARPSDPHCSFQGFTE